MPLTRRQHMERGESLQEGLITFRRSSRAFSMARREVEGLVVEDASEEIEPIVRLARLEQSVVPYTDKFTQIMGSMMPQVEKNLPKRAERKAPFVEAENQPKRGKCMQHETLFQF